MHALVAIPVYNEQDYVDRVIERVRAFAAHVLVIDDGSTDETPLRLARHRVEVVRHAENRGYGRSLIDAFRWAECYGFDWLVTMDCDEQHEPAALPSFFEAAERGDADVVSGSRYLRTEAGDDPPPADRRAINAEITETINRRLGIGITDAFCGFKAYRVAAVKALPLSEPGYAFPMQFWVQAAAWGLRIREIPIRLIYRDASRSFGGPLDDPEHRRSVYDRVLEREIARFPRAEIGSCCAEGGAVDAPRRSGEVPE